MKFDKQTLKNKLKGSSAEEIFSLMHQELGCEVYPTGHEVLYPTLLQNANFRRKVHHKLNKESDLEAFPLSTESEAKNKVDRERFINSEWGVNISSAPDFTIVTPAGMILQFEVKYRKSGILREDELQKYGSKSPAPFIFLIMKIEPYFKILSPGVHNIHHLKIFDKLKNKDGKSPIIELEQITKALWDLTVEKKITKEEFEEFRKEMEKLEGVKGTYQETIGINEEGDIALKMPKSLPSDYLVYPSEIIQKYKEIIKEHYSFQ